MKQNKRYAVTGGLGSGKSAVCAILKKRGFPVFSCDEIYRGLYAEPSFQAGLIERFPACAVEGEVPKRTLAELVFSDAAALRRLNEYAHPLIMDSLMKETSGLPLSFSEVPLLFEGGYERLFDGVIAVVRDKPSRVRAAMERDGMSEADVLRRMAAQIDWEVPREGCFLLRNDGDLETLERRVDELLRSL